MQVAAAVLVLLSAASVFAGVIVPEPIKKSETPSAPKSPIEKPKADLSEKDTNKDISPATATDLAGDDVNRKKKSTTTFCVEIRPNNPYQHPFQVCEPEGGKQPYAAPAPAPAAYSYAPAPAKYEEPTTHKPAAAYSAPSKPYAAPASAPAAKPAYAAHGPSYSSVSYRGAEDAMDDTADMEALDEEVHQAEEIAEHLMRTHHKLNHGGRHNGVVITCQPSLAGYAPTYPSYAPALSSYRSSTPRGAYSRPPHHSQYGAAPTSYAPRPQYSAPAAAAPQYGAPMRPQAYAPPPKQTYSPPPQAYAPAPVQSYSPPPQKPQYSAPAAAPQYSAPASYGPPRRPPPPPAAAAYAPAPQAAYAPPPPAAYAPAAPVKQYSAPPMRPQYQAPTAYAPPAAPRPQAYAPASPAYSAPHAPASPVYSAPASPAYSAPHAPAYSAPASYAPAAPPPPPPPQAPAYSPSYRSANDVVEPTTQAPVPSSVEKEQHTMQTMSDIKKTEEQAAAGTVAGAWREGAPIHDDAKMDSEARDAGKWRNADEIESENNLSN